MFKRFLLIVSVVMLLIGLTLSYSAPLFIKKGKTVQAYIGSSSSLARIEEVDALSFMLLKGVKGESVELDYNEFNLSNFLKEFRAKLLFIEQTEEGVSYYAYSPKIPYQKRINGKTVNLHVFVASERVKVGSPIIFGSF
jgi:hypothetical protein